MTRDNQTQRRLGDQADGEAVEVELSGLRQLDGTAAEGLRGVFSGVQQDRAALRDAEPSRQGVPLATAIAISKANQVLPDFGVPPMQPTAPSAHSPWTAR